jgi:glutathionyl-hydroquinone reductase
MLKAGTMGWLNQGKWDTEPTIKTNAKGQFIRANSSFRHTIGPKTPFPAEPNRYQLLISLACPWAHRTLIFRHLKGLEKIITVSITKPHLGTQGWAFTPETPGPDAQKKTAPKYLHQWYTHADPNITGRVTVPVLWDKQKKTIVNNESSDIIRIFNTAFATLGANPTNYYPSKLRPQINKLNAFIYTNINNGVYQAGFAKSQTAYVTATKKLFAALDHLDLLLSTQRYLTGPQLTEADWRLFPTLIRFDAVYVNHFKTNLKQISAYPNLYNYMKELYQIPGIKQTVDFHHIKTHYFTSHPWLNPSGIIPLGPIEQLDQPHQRSHLPQSAL